MFERFTDRARRVVVLAQEEARKLSHNYIGTEHLLLGLLHEGEGIAGLVLTDLGVTPDGLRAEVREIIGQGQQAPSGHIPFTPRARKVLELALREALQLGHEYIATEHILLALIREGEGVGVKLLVKSGLNVPAIRAAVLTKLDSYEKPKPPTMSVTEFIVAQAEASNRLAFTSDKRDLRMPDAPTGVWVAFYGDGSSAVPFATEVEAYRHALPFSMNVEFTKFGEAVGRPGSAA